MTSNVVMTSNAVQETLWSNLGDCQSECADVSLDTRESRLKPTAGV